MGCIKEWASLPMLHLLEGRITAGVDAEVDVYKGFYHVYDMLEPDTAERSSLHYHMTGRAFSYAW